MKTLILVAYFLHTGLGSIQIPYNDPTKCGTGSYFQYPSLLCVSCDSNQIKNTDLSCKCASGFRITQNSGGPDLSCVACPSEQVTSKDGWNCVKCPIGRDYNSASKTCTPCPTNTTLVERQANGSLFPDHRQKCLACLSDTKASKEMGICQRCNSFVLAITRNSSCTCPVDASTIGKFIFLRSGGNKMAIKFSGIPQYFLNSLYIYIYSVRAFEWNSVVVGSNPTQSNFL